MYRDTKTEAAQTETKAACHLIHQGALGVITSVPAFESHLLTSANEISNEFGFRSCDIIFSDFSHTLVVLMQCLGCEWVIKGILQSATGSQY